MSGWTTARLVAVALVAVLVIVGCGDTSGSGGSGTGTTSTNPDGRARVVDGVEALCDARAAAATDVNSARATFYDRSHEPLHTLARDLQSVDRPLAARLLEAKEAVEADLRDDPAPPALGADLDRLVTASMQALARLSLPASPCR